MVVLVPVPEVVVPPGVLVNVQVPVAGKPFKTTLPVDKAHVGCVIVSATGPDGETFIVRSVPLGLLVVTGLLDTTLIL
jgi:hypothetical protein